MSEPLITQLIVAPSFVFGVVGPWLCPTCQLWFTAPLQHQGIKHSADNKCMENKKKSAGVHSGGSVSFSRQNIRHSSRDHSIWCHQSLTLHTSLLMLSFFYFDLTVLHSSSISFLFAFLIVWLRGCSFQKQMVIWRLLSEWETVKPGWGGSQYLSSGCHEDEAECSAFVSYIISYFSSIVTITQERHQMMWHL